MARTSSSSAAVRRRVNARETSRRSRVWLGGSLRIIIPLSTGSGLISSRTLPCAELNRVVSFNAAATSSYRDSAQKFRRGLK